MSSINANSASQGLFQYFQQITSDQQTQTASTAEANPSATTSSTDGQQVQGAHHHHHGGGGGGDFQKVEQAVTTALAAAQGSDSSSDPNTIIQNAIASVLDPSDGAGAMVSGDTTGDPTSTLDALDGTAAQGTTSGAGSLDPAFAQALQSAGIDPAQFHADFLAAVKDAQAGNSNPATAFQSVPLGVNVNTVV